MAKNTHAQEVSTGDSASFTEHELSDPIPPPVVTITRMNLGGEVSSPVNREDGTESSTSSESVSTSRQSQPHNPPQPAPTMENRSSQTPAEPVDSNAASTDGNGQTTGTESTEDDGDDPFEEAAEEVIPEEEESEKDSSPHETVPKPTSRGNRRTARKPSGGNVPKPPPDKRAGVRSTEDKFDF
jgi:hypothetical protein